MQGVDGEDFELAGPAGVGFVQPVEAVGQRHQVVAQRRPDLLPGEQQAIAASVGGSPLLAEVLCRAQEPISGSDPGAVAMVQSLVGRHSDASQKLLER